MPMDKSGKFHLNTQRAMAADKRPPKAPSAEPEPAEHGGNATTLHDHGDGTFHTEGPAGHMDHPHIGHALMHMAAHHAPGVKHMHVQHDGMEITSHQAGEDGEVEGPHNHENMEALKDHMDQFLNEEEHEPALATVAQRGGEHEMGY